MGASALRDLRRVFHSTAGTIRRRGKDVVALDGITLDVEPAELMRGDYSEAIWSSVEGRFSDFIRSMCSGPRSGRRHAFSRNSSPNSA